VGVPGGEGADGCREQQALAAGDDADGIDDLGRAGTRGHEPVGAGVQGRVDVLVVAEGGHRQDARRLGRVDATVGHRRRDSVPEP
jgi:hypothetical protein